MTKFEKMNEKNKKIWKKHKNINFSIFLLKLEKIDKIEFFCLNNEIFLLKWKILKNGQNFEKLTKFRRIDKKSKNISDNIFSQKIFRNIEKIEKIKKILKKSKNFWNNEKYWWSKFWRIDKIFKTKNQKKNFLTTYFHKNISEIFFWNCFLLFETLPHSEDC